MEETISLQELFKTLRKNLKLIALITLVAITIAGVISFWLLTPIYKSSTLILVNQSKEETAQGQFNTQDIQADLQLINTYNIIIKSPAILDDVIEELKLDKTAGGLTSQITVSSAQNSQVVEIAVEDESPKMAAKIANTTASVFQKKIKSLMNIDNIEILSEAEMGLKPSPIKPNPVLNMAIAAVIGLMIGVGVAFLREYLDTTVKTEQDIEELLGLPIIGLISPIPEEDYGKIEIKGRRRG